MYIVLSGDLQGGFTAIGPFTNEEDAFDWCDSNDVSTGNVFALTDPADA